MRVARPCTLHRSRADGVRARRFAGDNMEIPRVQNEYLGLTVGSVFIIFFTLIYYVIVLVIEICLIACPDTVPIILGAFRCNRRQAAGTKGSKQRRGSSADGGGVGLPGGPGGPGGESDMVVNPFLVRAMEGGVPDATVDGIVELDSVMRMSNPTPAMWKAVQHSYDRMYGMITTLRDEVRDAKRTVSDMEMAATGAGASMRDKPHRVQRTTFQPMIASGGDEDGGAFASANPATAATSSVQLAFAARSGASLKAHVAGRRASIARVSARSLRRPSSTPSMRLDAESLKAPSPGKEGES